MFVGGLGTGISQLLAGIYSDRPRMIKMEQLWITDRMKGNVYRKMFTIQGLSYLSSWRPPFFGNESSQWSCQIVPVVQAMSFCHRHSAHFKRSGHVRQTKPPKTPWSPKCEARSIRIEAGLPLIKLDLRGIKSTPLSQHDWNLQVREGIRLSVGAWWIFTLQLEEGPRAQLDTLRHPGFQENFMAMMILTLSMDYLKGQSTGNGKERGASWKKNITQPSHIS